MNTKYIRDQIEREIEKTDYIYDDYDRSLLKEMFDCIFNAVGIQYNYLAEIACQTTPNASDIVAKYYNRFHSESVRAYLIPQIILDNPRAYGEVVLYGYLRFKNSIFYISDKGRPAPTHIYSRYDKALSVIKPRQLEGELLVLGKFPRDIVYLPFTMKMLASWKPPELEEYITRYFSALTIPEAEFGFYDSLKDSYPTLPFMRRELLFYSIACSVYYPTEHIISNLKLLISTSDLDVRTAAQKALKKIQSSNQGTVL